MKKASGILIVALLVVVLGSCGNIALKGLIEQKVTYSTPLKVLVVIPNVSQSFIDAAMNGLKEFSNIKSVDHWEGSTIDLSPTLAQLQAYDVIFLAADAPLYDLSTLCDNLALYLDGGGRVVLDTFDWQGPGITGRLYSQYSPFQGFADLYTNANLGTSTAGHPVMDGVSSLQAYFRDDVTLSPGATGIAYWDDPVPVPLAAEMGHVVALNAALHVPSTLNANGWTGDGWTLLHNAIEYIANK